MRRLSILLAVLISACGSHQKDEEPLKEASSPTPTSFFVQTAAELPECNEGRKGSLAYAQATSQFLACDGASWSPVPVKGEDGTDNRVLDTIYCQGDLENTQLSFEYNAVKTAAGDVFARGSIRLTDMWVTNSAFYAANQDGAQSAAVLIGADVVGTANHGFWDIRVDRDSLITSITYTDDDVPGGDTWSMEPENCQISKGQ
jgi:hypothetical protein